jgi:hypothetical protein
MAINDSSRELDLVDDRKDFVVPSDVVVFEQHDITTHVSDLTPDLLKSLEDLHLLSGKCLLVLKHGRDLAAKAAQFGQDQVLGFVCHWPGATSLRPSQYIE